MHSYLPNPPLPNGGRRPNGAIIVTDERHPSELYKFTPWGSSALAFCEVDAYARLRDIADPTGIVQLVGISGTQNHFIRVVERSHKGSLDRFLLDAARGDYPTLDTDVAQSVLAQIAETMAHMHAIDLVHRDLKAENVLVFDGDADSGSGKSLRVKVSDFDRTAALPPGELLRAPVGSLFHMAPELLAQETYDRKVDVYAFGILIFEVLHGGARPYTNVATGMPGSLPRAEFAEKVIKESYRPEWLHEDKELKQLAMRCWTAEPSERPEFHQLFSALKKSSPWHRSLPPEVAAPSKNTDAIPGIGIAATMGDRRRTMEDTACVLKTPDALILGVFDGLRGAHTAEFAARQLVPALADALAEHPRQPEDAIRATFDLAENTLRRMSPPIECGSTATVVLLNSKALFVSWLGDSPAYLFRKDDQTTEVAAVRLVNDHHPGREDERVSVTARGGEIRREQKMLETGETVPWGPLRVFAADGGKTGGVALSRSLGLFPLKPAIGNAPETIRLERRQDQDLFLVVGSDGVFEVLKPDDAYEIAAAASSAQEAADAIIAAVHARGAPDNASVIVVDLKSTG
ncbi:MAG TPA: bifunctional serine/threonine-protein kinase/phosphatase [Hyphomicrobium sp.]|nr:bifunctional serine/threonine-protein kinase/phosphatase [Hyphomicrobium sp.]